MSPVSYTHLDVYKRQTLGCNFKEEICKTKKMFETAKLIKNFTEYDFKDNPISKSFKSHDLSNYLNNVEAYKHVIDFLYE